VVLIGSVAIGLALWVWLGSRARPRLQALQRGAVGTTTFHPEPADRGKNAHRLDSRVQIVAQAPVIADLLSAAIAAGASVHDALDVVIAAIDEPARSRLQAVRASTQLGAPATIAWADLLDDDALAPIAGAIIRSSRTGASIASVLDAAAVDMRQAHRAQVEVAARSAGVRSVAPLALCFLPAYLLVGVVPVVAGFARSLFG